MIDVGQISGFSETIGTLWCRLIHDSPTWPIHGHYHCRTCRRTYTVPWGDAAAGVDVPHTGSQVYGTVENC